jgi:hypothetical protein
MALKFGKIRYTKDANGSPYRCQLGYIKAQASDFKWLREPSAISEEEKAGKEGPSGNITVYIYVYIYNYIYMHFSIFKVTFIYAYVF